MKLTKGELLFWSVLIVGAATAVILYQQSLHTSAILSLSAAGVASDVDLSGTIGPATSIPAVKMSTATGVYTPLGPDQATSVFPYNPPQNLS